MTLPRKLKDPMTYAAGYALHLYCRYANPEHGFNEFPHQPEACQTFAEAARLAKSRGWKIHRDRTATCPKCVAALARKRKMVGDAGIEPATFPV